MAIFAHLVDARTEVFLKCFAVFFAGFGIPKGVYFKLDVLEAKHLEGIDGDADAFGIEIWAIFSNAFNAGLDELTVSAKLWSFITEDRAMVIDF